MVRTHVIVAAMPNATVFNVLDFSESLIMETSFVTTDVGKGRRGDGVNDLLMFLEFPPCPLVSVPGFHAALSEKASLPNRSSSPGLIACGVFGRTFLRLTKVPFVEPISSTV